jgi:2'-5' RNA ligase
MPYMINSLLRGPIEAYQKDIVRHIAEKFPSLTHTKEQGLDAHFTLKYPFETDDINEIESLISIFTATHVKTPVRVGGFRDFGGQTMFIDVNPSQSARSVFVDFIAELRKINWMQWYRHDGEGLHFHSTVAEKTAGLHEQILDFLKGKDKYFDVYFDNITLLKFTGMSKNGVGLWEIYKTFEVL